MVPWKHPHARGEDIKSASATRFKMETPPRTWGRPDNFPAKDPADRNTPTHVGKTRLASYTERGIQKHPHARGEDPPDLHKAWRQRETPPRTWGRHPLLILLGGNDRNTPTHVGKTWLRSGPATLGRKHPHARGEDPLPDDSTPSRPETPPRTWGRPGGSGLILPDDGNPPTHVGKTPPVWPCTLPTQKHPHARGEDQHR